jgi:hypothetical protein
LYDVTELKVSEKKPFMALLWLHTNHEPHPALPQFYHNYTDVFGDPAGDYLGTATPQPLAPSNESPNKHV